jgi:hypothetical protein
MKPKSLLDRSFRYTPSFETNLKNTFARVRRELREAEAKAVVDEAAKKALQTEQKKPRPVTLTRIYR